MRVSIEDSPTRKGKDLVVYLDDGSRIYTQETPWPMMGQHALETMLEAVREEAKADAEREADYR